MERSAAPPRNLQIARIVTVSFAGANCAPRAHCIACDRFLLAHAMLWIASFSVEVKRSGSAGRRTLVPKHHQAIAAYWRANETALAPLLLLLARTREMKRSPKSNGMYVARLKARAAMVSVRTHQLCIIPWSMRAHEPRSYERSEASSRNPLAPRGGMPSRARSAQALVIWRASKTFSRRARMSGQRTRRSTVASKTRSAHADSKGYVRFGLSFTIPRNPS